MAFGSYLKPLALSIAMTSPAALFACEADEMAKTENGFIFKVVAGSNKILAYTDPSGTDEAFPMELLQPYFVICDAGDYYRITDLPANTVDEALSGNTGFVLKDQTHLWPTREALSFSEIAFLEDRPEMVAWDDEVVLDKFMESGDQKLNPPAFREDLEATRMRERATRPYPVLGSDMRKLRKIADKRVYNVLLPAAITPQSVIEFTEEDVDKVEEALLSASILVVFDATGSMEGFARSVAKTISDSLASMPQAVRDGSSMGFVFYRDVGDAEKLVDTPMVPLKEAAVALNKAAEFMTGGGDAAEPVLDAAYYANHLYDWSQSGRRVMIVVLNGDAKPTTIGGLDDKGRIAAGYDALTIARQLYDEAIPVITVQAGPGIGPNFVSVMSTLADETGGEFLKWEGASVTEASMSAALARAMTAAAEVKISSGKTAIGKVAYDLNGFASIPLEVLDGEMLETLRRAGVDFNIDPGEGGVLVREGFILENTDLLSPQIQIEKQTLLDLINLYSVLSTVGVDEEAMLQSISEAVAAIAGEDFDPSEPIESIIEKKLGIQFRSDLLNFDINYLPALLPKERLALTKRIQDAATILNQYFEANQPEFDEQVAVWMPVDILP